MPRCYLSLPSHFRLGSGAGLTTVGLALALLLLYGTIHGTELPYCPAPTLPPRQGQELQERLGNEPHTSETPAPMVRHVADDKSTWGIPILKYAGKLSQAELLGNEHMGHVQFWPPADQIHGNDPLPPP